jgi:hypothetical protein
VTCYVLLEKVVNSMKEGDLVQGPRGIYGIIIKTHVVRLDLDVRYDVLLASQMFYNLNGLCLEVIR